MSTAVAEFIEKSRKARSLDELYGHLEQTIESLGFTRWAYQIVNPPHDRDKRPVILTNYPEKWVTHYLDRKYHQVDHVILKGPSQIMPFTWNSLCHKYGMTAQQKQFFGEAADYGLPDGLGIPIHGGNGGYAMMSLATGLQSDELQRFLKDSQDSLHIIALVFNTVARDLLDAMKFGTIPPQLTPREKECLLWFCRGKTVMGIAEKLGISEITVKYHLGSVRTKFGVLTTKEAMVHAIMFRIIEP